MISIFGQAPIMLGKPDEAVFTDVEPGGWDVGRLTNPQIGVTQLLEVGGGRKAEIQMDQVVEPADCPIIEIPASIFSESKVERPIVSEAIDLRGSG